MTVTANAEITRLRNRISLLEEQLRDALAAARTDPLTGLYNRGGLAEAYASIPRTCQLALLDLDRFKQINDVHGHAAGDAVLVHVGEQISRYSIAARLGGDEFVVVTAFGFDTWAWPVPLPDGSTITVTATVGITEVVPGDLYETLRRADAAMYRAKQYERGSLASYIPAVDDRPREIRPRLRLRDAASIAPGR